MIELNDTQNTIIVKVKEISYMALRPFREPTRWEIQDRENVGLPAPTPHYDLQLNMSRGDVVYLNYPNPESRQRDYDLILNSLRTP